jgi:gamma-glutamylputrescine oxidase
MAGDPLGMDNSYYVATARPFAPAPVLDGAIDADVLVIGGGVTGLSAALHARALGLSVVLLEATRIGWGASGRNGGQMIPGLRKGAAELIAKYGRGDAKTIFDLALEARETTLGLIARHAIVCDLKTTGHMLAAFKPSDLAWIREEARALREVMNYQDVEVLDAQQARAEIGSPLYHGALLDRLGGHLHPLNYTLGLGDAARKAGVQIFEHSPATLADTAKGVSVRTPRGSVTARYGVLACDAFTGEIDKSLATRAMPVASYIAATAPLADPAALIAHDRAISDSRFVVNYFRLSADGRLLFGGGERYTPRPPRDIAGFVRAHMVKVFPTLTATPIDYAWGGMVSITRTRLPHIGRRGDLVFAHGLSGQGVLLSGFAGKVMAEALGGLAGKLDIFARLTPPAFPGGAVLRDPLYVLGMLWFALRDRL